MSGEQANIFNTIINYTTTEEPPVDYPHIGAYSTIDSIAESKFDIQKKRIKDVLKNRTFEVPDYQRIYSWETEQHYEVWEEIQDIIDARITEHGEEEMSDTFFGSMYFADKASGDGYEIIDGQQRITTLAILFRVILEHVEETIPELGEEDEFRTLGSLVSDQLEDILYEVDPLTGREPSFVLNKHDREFFNHLLLGEEARLEYLISPQRDRIDGRKGVAKRVNNLVDRLLIDDELIERRDVDKWILDSFIPLYDSNERLLKAYRFYYDRIESVVEDREDPRQKIVFLMNLSNYVQRSFFIGRFEISDTGSEFRMRIFEILNDRGIDLTKIDRIRANVVNRFSGEDDRDEYIDKWENIVAEFGTSASKIETFLGVYLAAVDPNVDSQNEAKQNLKHAFSMRTPPTVSIEPRLETVSQAKNFIDEINDYLLYYDHIVNPHLDENTLELRDSVRAEAEDILKRLNKLGTSQWVPLILYTYRFTDKYPGEDEAFLRLLQTVENINIRRLLADVNPNVVENLFVDASSEFQQYVEQDHDEPYDRIVEFLIESLESNTSQLFGHSLKDSLIQYVDWSDNYSKQILWKISAEEFQASTQSVNKQLNISDLHLEHVLPKNLIGKDGDATWVQEFFKTESSNKPIANLATEFVSLSRLQETERNDEQEERLEEINNFLQQRFVNDIANCLLLKGSDNRAAGNSLLSRKVIAYYNTGDFEEIHVNRFFTGDNPDFPEGHKEQLLTQYEMYGENVDEVDESVRQKFDSFWTYERFKERRIDLIVDMLESLSFETRPEEFDFDREFVSDEMEEEMERRLGGRSL